MKNSLSNLQIVNSFQRQDDVQTKQSIRWHIQNINVFEKPYFQSINKMTSLISPHTNLTLDTTVNESDEFKDQQKTESEKHNLEQDNIKKDEELIQLILKTIEKYQGRNEN